jgi:hypothetical protein
MSVSVASCSASIEVTLTDEEKATIAAEVDSICDQVWYPIWEALEFDRGLSMIVDAPETAWVWENMVVYTRTGIDEAFRPGLAGLQRQEFDFPESRTIVLAPDVAYTIRAGTVLSVDEAGEDEPEIPFAETTVWVKRNGEWKVLLGHGSEVRE